MLLLLIDKEDFNNFMTNINLICLKYNIKILLGFNFQEIGKYIKSS